MGGGNVMTENLVLQKTRVDSLLAVKNLSLWGIDLDDVTLVAKMANVEVLSLSVNRISSLQPFKECRLLRELYLRKNEVKDLGQVAHLTSLPLKLIWLCDNPCAQHPLYRIFTIRCCPHLAKLDNIDVAPQERQQAEKLSKKDIQSILLSASDTSVLAYLGKLTGDAHVGVDDPLVDVVIPARSPIQPVLSPNRGSQAPPPLPPSAVATPSTPSGANNAPLSRTPSSAGSSGTAAQRAMIAAVLALIPEMTKESQMLIYRDLSHRLKSDRS